MSGLPATSTLAADIQRHHEAAQRCAGEAVEHARLAGDKLLQAKAELGHGNWLRWFDEAGFGFGERQARNYMRLARELPRLAAEDRQRVADLSLREALGAIATRRPQLCEGWFDTVLRHLDERAALEQAFKRLRAELDAIEAMPVDADPPPFGRLNDLINANHDLHGAAGALQLRMQRHLGAAFRDGLTLADVLGADAAGLAAAGLPDVSVEEWLSGEAA